MEIDHGTCAGPDDESRVCEVLAAYFDALEAGQAPDRAVWLARYPDLAGELAAFLEEEDRLLLVTGPLRSTKDGNAGGSSPDRSNEPKFRLVPGGNGTANLTAGLAVHVFGDYELLGEPIQGGMSFVYRAVQLSLNRPVALKMLRGGTLADRDEMRRFRLEAAAVADLDHPNIVPIYEVGEHDGLCYFAMKLIEGGSLAQRLAEYGPVPQVAASLMATVARAVHHAHQRGILHRDLKPSNIVIDTEGQPHVTDFGLAKRMGGDSELTQSGAILGTPSYMAPEQASGRNKAITTATDVYGLGSVLYALLTGKPPFKGDSVHETLELVRQQPPEPPSGVGRNVDRDLETICLKCLEKDPERRYGSALAVAEDLERWLRGEPTVARPLSRPARLRRWTWRWRGRMAAAATALVMLALIGLGTRQTIRLRQAAQLAQEQQRAIRRSEAETRQAQYLSDIHRASVLIAHGEAQEARDLLDERTPAAGGEDLRGFEWSRLRGLSDTGRRSWIGHDRQEVYHVEYAPDGRTLVTAGQDRTARIWDADTGQQRLVIRGHGGEVADARFDPSGTRLVTAGDDATVRIWSAVDGGQLTVFDRLHSPTVAALFTRDGHDVIAAARDGTLVRWDAATGRRRATCKAHHHRDEPWVESLAISPQGATLALAGQNEHVQLFDLSHGGLAAVTRPMENLDTNGFCVAFAPDGRSLAATGKHNVHPVLYDATTGKRQVTLEGPSNPTFTLAFAPDGRTVAVGDDRGTIRIWDLATRSFRVSLRGHTGRIWCVASSPDGRTLATTSRDGTIRLWDARPRSDRAVFFGLARLPLNPNCKAHANSVAFSPDGTQLLAANDCGSVLACNLKDGTAHTLRTADQRFVQCSASLAPDGSAIAVSEMINATSSIVTEEDKRYKIVIYDLSGCRGPVTLPVELRSATWRWSPDSSRLAVAEPTGDLTLRDALTGRVLGRAAAGYGDGSSSLAFQPTGDAVIAVCGDNRFNFGPFELVAWKPGTPHLDRRPIPIHGERPWYRLLLSPDGRNLADLAGTRARLWDFPTLQRRSLLVGHNGPVQDLAFAPDGRTLATAGHDKTVRLWSVASGQELLVLEGHTDKVRALAFSRDGRMLASCGDADDGGIEAIIWYAEGSRHSAVAAGRADSQPTQPPAP